MRVCVLSQFVLLRLRSVLFLLRRKNEIDPQVRQKTFDVVWKTVNEKFYDPKFGGVDWAKIHEKYEPQVANVKTDNEFYELLEIMLKELHVSHIGVIRPEDLDRITRPEVITGFALKDIDNQVVITRIVGNSSAAKAGLRLGFVIKKIDDAAITNSKEAFNKLTSPQQKYRVSFLNENNELHEIVFDRQPLPSEMLEKVEVTKNIVWTAFIESKRLTDGIGYIHFTNFIIPLKKKLRAAIESMKDAPAIIFDFRGNGGGDSGLSLMIANMLLDKKIQLAISRRREGDDYYFQAKPEKNPYLKTVVMLVDENSGSAPELLSATLQEIGRVIVIGKRTAGAVLEAVGKKLPTGALLFYPYGQPRTAKGIIIEGRGVIPDIEVNLTRAELLKGKDSQLEAAIEYIKKQK